MPPSTVMLVPVILKASGIYFNKVFTKWFIFGFDGGYLDIDESRLTTVFAPYVNALETTFAISLIPSKYSLTGSIGASYVTSIRLA